MPARIADRGWGTLLNFPYPVPAVGHEGRNPALQPSTDASARNIQNIPLAFPSSSFHLSSPLRAYNKPKPTLSIFGAGPSPVPPSILSASFSSSASPSLAAVMAKQSKAKKPENLGRGKVTPVQIAFIVDRYLADNSYSNTLSAFRAEASDLFSKTRGKEVPKGLLGLGEILDEYISLKEQRVKMDQEKRRVEMALQGMQDVIRAYHGAGSPALPPSPPLLPPQFVATPMAPVLPAPYPANGSSPGHAVIGSPVVNNAQPPNVLPYEITEPNNCITPIPNSSSANKRKASKSSKVPLAPKKPRTESPTTSSILEGNVLSLDATCTDSSQGTQKSAAPSTSSHVMIRSPVQGCSIAKSLFNESSDSQTNSSPKTPPQTLSAHADKVAMPPANPSFQKTNSITSHQIASSSCFLVASETIIVSPVKGMSYYDVERSYHITAPYKSSPEKLSKREHVKGKLDFDEPDIDVPMSSEKLILGDSSTSSNEAEAAGSFDFNLSDFDMLDHDFSFSELLADIDIDFEAIPSCQPAAGLADSIPGPENNSSSECSERSLTLTDSSLTTLSGALSENEMNIQGPDTVTSLRSITKRIRIVSPVKSRRNCSLEQNHSSSAKA